MHFKPQLGNSNSLAQLVDNEIPLAQMDVPMYSQQTATQARQYRSHRHHKQRQQELLASASNGGDGAQAQAVSYENQLASANSEDELDHVVVGSTEVVAAVAAIATNKRHRSGSYSNLFDANFETALTNNNGQHPSGATTSSAAAAGIVVGKPTTAGAALLAAAISGDRSLAKSVSQTENMYSNVPHNGTATAAGGSSDPTALHVYSNIIDERQQQQQQHQQDTVLSSTLLSDDLDLDDPVASFVATHSQRKSGGDGAEQVKTADRLRILHDTTMIDTALDLDSLDGSSMGNSSQSCLVKTAKQAAAVATSANPIGSSPAIV